MKRFVVGSDWQETSDSMRTFDIDDKENNHHAKIEVHGDRKLRDLIVRLLNDHFGNFHNPDEEPK